MAYKRNHTKGRNETIAALFFNRQFVKPDSSGILQLQNPGART